MLGRISRPASVETLGSLSGSLDFSMVGVSDRHSRAHQTNECHVFIVDL